MVAGAPRKAGGPDPLKEVGLAAGQGATEASWSLHLGLNMINKGYKEALYYTFHSHLVLETRDGHPEDLEKDLESVRGHLSPPLPQDGPLHVLQDPQQADQSVASRALLQHDRTLSLSKMIK